MLREVERTESPSRVRFVLESDAASLHSMTKDLSDAVLFLFDEMRARLDRGSRHCLLICLWLDYGKLTFQVYPKGLIPDDFSLGVQFICDWLSTMCEDEDDEEFHRDGEALRESDELRNLEVTALLEAACRPAAVMDAWVRVVRNVKECIVYVQADEDHETRELFSCLATSYASIDPS